MLSRNALLTVFALSVLVLRSEAQTQAFLWTFGNNFVLTEIQECQNLSIVVSPKPNSTSAGTPPYYLLAFEVGGVPTTTLVGSDPAKLSWQANHARGSSLMLTIVDSTGSTGGIPPNLFNITAGSTTSCLPSKPPSSSLASITPNVTTALTTCQPWGLTISGGTKPYQVVLSARNSPVITNVTMGAGDDVFTFVDRADPNTVLMANVLDATGQWGISTNVISTTGSTNIDCVGLISSSKTTQQIEQEAIDQAAAAAAAAKHRRTMRIVGIVLGVCLPILLILAVLGFWWRRRQIILKDRDRGVWDGQDVNARVWELPSEGGEMVQIAGADIHQSLLDHKRSLSNPEPGVPDTPSSIPMRTLPSEAYADYAPDVDGAVSPGPSSSTSQSESTRPTGLSALTPRQRKALEAQGLTPSSSSSHLPPGALPPTMPGGPRPRIMHSSEVLNSSAGPDIIIQHRDGGAGVVQELPPPYMNRQAAGDASGTDPDTVHAR